MVYFLIQTTPASVVRRNSAEEAIEAATAEARRYPGTPIEVLKVEPYATLTIPAEPEPIISWAQKPFTPPSRED